MSLGADGVAVHSVPSKSSKPLIAMPSLPELRLALRAGFSEGYSPSKSNPDLSLI
ncbi:unnamed protein product [Arabis nemorensis]|uniref:Uncharacterized protein n=1 Tax=Arabis nemorensis TaxID=586526 RepID=A0A565BD97_9BRAS|nr:unnamed protein product [Arabis nemorensis]